MKYQILALSDLHLGEPQRDSRYKQFLQLFDDFLTGDIQELLLMGDIFDILIGNKKFWKKIHAEFFERLERATKSGKKITWVQGNHDFQLSKLLAPYNIHWIEEHDVIQRGTFKISLSHGDLADDSNKLHPYWRRLLTSGLLSLFISIVPEFIAEKLLYPLTLKLSRASRKVSKSKADIAKGTETFRKHAAKLNEKFKVDLVILGHSHIQDQYALSNKSTYFNLGSWYETPQIGLIEIASDGIDLKVYPLSTWLASISKQ